MHYNRAMSRPPIIGITMDNDPDAPAPPRLRVSQPYIDAVAEAGGLPIALPQRAELAGEYVALCDGVILTGGDDPAMEPFGEATHPQARRIDAQRQQFELALLDALERVPAKPALGICLGMQLMALHAGGKLNQYLRDTLDDGAALHADGCAHAIVLNVENSVLLEPQTRNQTPETRNIYSHHRQAVADPGRLRTIATAPDGVIEAIDAPPGERPFYLGVQWHPERAEGDHADGPLNRGLIRRFVRAARATT
ncbi:MAG: gamma-glutamyl-gamma-aminobutyrate hydrolase family protein [Phycisphaeraceae bacterium]